jgi:hypothetical protein
MRGALSVILLSVAGFCSSSSRPVPVVAQQANLPIEFEANTGQFPSEVAFGGHGKRFHAYFTESGPVLIMESNSNSVAIKGINKQAIQKLHGAVIQMKLVGAHAKPEGIDRTEGVSNYFIGNDPARWRVAVPHFAKVTYRNAYPGIDIVFYSGKSGLEYDVVAAAGADLAQVAIAFEGATISKDSRGALQIHTDAGTIHQTMAAVFEEKNGRQRALRCNFVLAEGNIVHLASPERDLNARLVVDPVLEYSTFLGGSQPDTAISIAIDSTGHAYVTGGTGSTDFPTTAGAFDRTCTGKFGCNRAFVAKLNPSGTGLIYSTFLGGNDSDAGTGIAIDSSGNAYVTGVTNSTDFPGTFLSSTRGIDNAFVTKLNPAGSALVYSALFGGSVTNEAVAIALDSAHNAYITGNSQSNDFPTTNGAFQTAAAGDFHPFLTKVNSTGTAFVYSTRIAGSTSTDFADSIAIDSSNNVYVVGDAGSDDFPTTPGVIQQTKPPNTRTGFVAKVNPTGSDLVYSTFWGDVVRAVAVDASHNAFVTGEAQILPTTSGAFQRAQKGGGDAFVSKISPTGQALLYSTFLGGSQFDFGAGIAINQAGEAYILGGTLSSDLPVTSTAFEQFAPPGLCGDTASSPCLKGFVAKLNATGTLSYSSYLSGGDDVVDTSSGAPGQTIQVDANGSAYAVLSSGSQKFPTTNTALKQKVTDPQDGVVAKITPLCALNSASPSVTICTPGNGADVTSPVTIIAGSHGAHPVKLLQVYVDGAKKYEAALSAIGVKLAIPVGMHRVTVQAIDTSKVVFKTSINVNVAP